MKFYGEVLEKFLQHFYRRSAGEIPPAFLQEILQPVMEKNEKCFLINKRYTSMSLVPVR